ncbi:MAG: cation:proton antiporter [Actinobacteria bacterium]|nr:cation:proton antiporter [Actinomycetota bacterium]
MTAIQPLGEHEIVVLLLQLAMLLLVARFLGEVAVRFDLPSVVGELLAGIVLGPSILGTIAPGVFEFLVPADPAQFHLLEVVSFLGVLMLLVVTGLETDVGLILRKGRSAAAISLGGIVVPFVTGFALGQLLPESFLVDAEKRLVFSLFIATAMSISAIPVIAKVLIEMNVVRRDIGQITLAAGMIDDTIGWILLSVVAGLARSGAVDLPAVMQSVLSVVVVVGLAFTAGRKLVPMLFRAVDNRIPGDKGRISLLMILALGFGSVTHALGIEAVLGAFLAGILVGQVKRVDHKTRHVFETVALGVFAPIFFAASGLRVDLELLLKPTNLAIGLIVLAVAIFGKFVGAALGAKASGLRRWEALSLGAGMNARGALEIIVATVGLSLGVLTPEMYSIILMVAIVTSLMAPPILRWTLRHIPMSDEERARLEAEERQRVSFVENLHRVLLPSRGGENSQLAAQLVARLFEGQSDVEVTTMFVATASPESTVRRAAADPVSGGVAVAANPTVHLERLERQLASVPSGDRRRIVDEQSPDIIAAVVTELGRGYDLLVLGASEPQRPSGNGGPMFSSVVDRLIQEAPCPTVIVSNTPSGDRPEQLPPLNLRRILLPTTGTETTRHAAEIAFRIGRSSDAVVEIVHVVDDRQDRDHHNPAAYGTGRQSVALGEELLAATATLGHQMGTAVRTRLVVGDLPERSVIALCESLAIDLVVMSGGVRPVSQRAFLGHRVDHVLRYAPCPVLVAT